MLSNRRTIIYIGLKWLDIERRTPKGFRDRHYQFSVITPSSRKRLAAVGKQVERYMETTHTNGSRTIEWGEDTDWSEFDHGSRYGSTPTR